MFRIVRGVAVLAVLAGVSAGCGSDADSGATVSFDTPTEGSRVAGGVDVAMSADGVEIEPAGEAREGAGHFHVIADAGCVDAGETIGKDTDHVHVGTGSSTTTIYLSPGEHTLCLQVGDGVHTALSTTDTVEIEVGIGDQGEFCDVLGELDPILDGVWEEADFAVGQAKAANAARLVEQLQAATPHVDADAQPAVEELLRFTASILDATAAATTPEDVEGQWAELSKDVDVATIEDVAFPWVSDTCGLDLE